MPGDPSIQELVAMVEEATQSLPGTIAPETQLGGLDGWDSMGLVVFIDLIRTHAAVELAVHDLRSCGSPLEIHDLLRRIGRP